MRWTLPSLEEILLEINGYIDVYSSDGEASHESEADAVDRHMYEAMTEHCTNAPAAHSSGMVVERDPTHCNGLWREGK